MISKTRYILVLEMEKYRDTISINNITTHLPVLINQVYIIISFGAINYHVHSS